MCGAPGGGEAAGCVGYTEAPSGTPLTPVWTRSLAPLGTVPAEPCPAPWTGSRSSQGPLTWDAAPVYSLPFVWAPALESCLVSRTYYLQARGRVWHEKGSGALGENTEYVRVSLGPSQAPRVLAPASLLCVLG